MLNKSIELERCTSDCLFFSHTHSFFFTVRSIAIKQNSNLIRLIDSTIAKLMTENK